MIGSSPDSTVIPGQCLGYAHEICAGDGCYAWGRYVRAAVSGTFRLSNEESGLPRASIAYPKNTSIVPAIGDEVTCRVIRIASRMATVDIICVGKDVLREPCTGLIRREDVRSFEQHTVEMYRSFRPGDIVLARVISLGDARAYLLSTAEPPLGVVIAKTQEGATLTPVSWEEMECPLTQQREFRKVAKPPIETAEV